MIKGKALIRFDWAMKKILRDKANFDILEGFLSELLRQDIKIKKILESESNQEDSSDKSNRVDILVENETGELVIVEIQNSQEYDYFHRILYGTSKIISEYMQRGDEYAKLKKVISITIAYFDLGKGEDYIYHGTLQFKGLHQKDQLTLGDYQRTLYGEHEVYKIYPEYWIIKVKRFGGVITEKLDEWIYFLKNSEVKADFSARGLLSAKDKLDEIGLVGEEKLAYKRYLRNLMDTASYNKNRELEVQEMEYLRNQVAKQEQELAQEKQELDKSKQEVAQEKQEVAQEKQELDKSKQEVAQEKQEVAQEKQEVAQEKQEVAQEKQEVAQEKQEVAQEKQVIQEKLTQVVLNLDKLGIPISEIQTTLDLSQTVIENILKTQSKL